jgi:hypothetical protein
MECGIALPEYLTLLCKKYQEILQDTRRASELPGGVERLADNNAAQGNHCKKSPTFFISILRIILFTVK